MIFIGICVAVFLYQRSDLGRARCLPLVISSRSCAGLAAAIGMTRVTAGIVLVMWFIAQLISGRMSVGATGGGVAFFAHIGGFIVGMELIGLFKRKDVRLFLPSRST